MPFQGGTTERVERASATSTVRRPLHRTTPHGRLRGNLDMRRTRRTAARALREPTMARRWMSAMVLVAGIVVWAPATWWVAGLVSSGTNIDDPDYLVRPVHLPALVEPTIGVAAVALVVGGLWCRRNLLAGWSQIVTACSAICGYVGLAYRVATRRSSVPTSAAASPSCSGCPSFSAWWCGSSSPRVIYAAAAERLPELCGRPQTFRSLCDLPQNCRT